MKCSDANALLDLMHDNELEPKDAALVLEHLGGCRPCADELESLQQLRNRFASVRSATPAAPAGMMAKIGAALDAEANVPSIRRKKRAAPYTVAWASALVASIAVVAMSVMPNAAVVTANRLIDDSSSTVAAAGLDDTTLSNKLGFEMHFMKLPGWRADRITPVADNSHIARVDFARSAGDLMSPDTLTCYQALAGTIHAPDGGAKVDLGARQVALGTRGKLSYAMWTQNERDYLMVTTMSTSALMELLRG